MNKQPCEHTVVLEQRGKHGCSMRIEQGKQGFRVINMQDSCNIYDHHNTVSSSKSIEILSSLGF